MKFFKALSEPYNGPIYSTIGNKKVAKYVVNFMTFLSIFPKVCGYKDFFLGGGPHLKKSYIGAKGEFTNGCFKLVSKGSLWENFDYQKSGNQANFYKNGRFISTVLLKLMNNDP